MLTLSREEKKPTLNTLILSKSFSNKMKAKRGGTLWKQSSKNTTEWDKVSLGHDLNQYSSVSGNHK